MEDEYQLKERIRTEVFSGLAVVLGDQAQSLKVRNVNTSGLDGGKVVKRDAVTSHDLIESQLVTWVREMVKSNYQLATVLQSLDQACRAILSGGTVTDVEELLQQAGGALQNAKHLKEMFMSDVDLAQREQN
jgi:hypothetical protein